MVKHGGKFRNDPHLLRAKEAERLAEAYTATATDPDVAPDIDPETRYRLKAEAIHARKTAAAENNKHASTVILARADDDKRRR